MRKTILSFLMLFLIIFLSACNKNKAEDNKTLVSVTPSTKPVVTIADEDTSGTDAKDDTSKLEILDYFPIQADTEYVYEGKGNEYASYNVLVDFVDVNNNKVQTRTNNGGSETVRVIEVKEGKVSVIYKVDECYYRDNLLDRTSSNKEEVLLMEPLTKGTEWTLPDGRKRYISEVDKEVTTPSGKYKAIEVITEQADFNTMDYYAPKVGLVKSIFSSNENDMEVSSSLSKKNTNTPFVQMINVYYPDKDEKLHTKSVNLTFRTGDVIRVVLQKALREQAIKESYLPLISENTVINSLYLGKDKIVYVDFSADLVKDMNLGAGFETLVLQCITNTLGNYYGVEKVYITVAGKPYESGHILMKKGETFKVNMNEVAE